MSLRESLAESHAYNPIRDSEETLGETFHSRQASPQSLGSDYMRRCPQDSRRDSFFTRARLPERIPIPGADNDWYWLEQWQIHNKTLELSVGRILRQDCLCNCEKIFV